MTPSRSCCHTQVFCRPPFSAVLLCKLTTKKVLQDSLHADDYYFRIQI